MFDQTDLYLDFDNYSDDEYIPEYNFPDGHRWEGKDRCLAQVKSTGLQCKNIPVTGIVICYVHGGKKWCYSGPKPGRAKKKITETAFALLVDPYILSLHQEIALLMTLIQDHLFKLGEYDVLISGAEAQKAIGLIDQGISEDDIGLCQEGYRRLIETKTLINQRGANIQKIFSLGMQKAQLVKVAMAWHFKRGRVIPPIDVISMLVSLQKALYETIDDLELQEEIAEAFRTVIEGPWFGFD